MVWWRDDRAIRRARQAEADYKKAREDLLDEKVKFASLGQRMAGSLERIDGRAFRIEQEFGKMRAAWQEFVETVKAERDFQRAFRTAVEGWMTKISEAPDITEVRQMTAEFKADIDEWRQAIAKGTPAEPTAGQ